MHRGAVWLRETIICVDAISIKYLDSLVGLELNEPASPSRPCFSRDQSNLKLERGDQIMQTRHERRIQTKNFDPKQSQVRGLTRQSTLLGPAAWRLVMLHTWTPPSQQFIKFIMACCPGIWRCEGLAWHSASYCSITNLLRTKTLTRKSRARTQRGTEFLKSEVTGMILAYARVN